MSGRNIEILIDEIVVHGAAGLDCDRFRTQVERELGRLLREEGRLPDFTEAASSHAAAPFQTVTVPPGQAPSSAQVARAVHRFLRGARKG